MRSHLKFQLEVSDFLLLVKMPCAFFKKVSFSAFVGYRSVLQSSLLSDCQLQWAFIFSNSSCFLIKIGMWFIFGLGQCVSWLLISHTAERCSKVMASLKPGPCFVTFVAIKTSEKEAVNIFSAQTNPRLCGNLSFIGVCWAYPTTKNMWMYTLDSARWHILQKHLFWWKSGIHPSPSKPFNLFSLVC